jgi:2-polyprenyl-6-methoxyphenol hydroxylase-like FAD-dependent oxidoreductase
MIALPTLFMFQILESASQLKEIGAAVTLGPGAIKILRRFGVHLENDGGVVTTHVSVWNGSGVQVASVPFNAMERAGEVNVRMGCGRHDAVLTLTLRSRFIVPICMLLCCVLPQAQMDPERPAKCLPATQ